MALNSETAWDGRLGFVIHLRQEYSLMKWTETVPEIFCDRLMLLIAREDSTECIRNESYGSFPISYYYYYYYRKNVVHVYFRLNNSFVFLNTISPYLPPQGLF